MRTDKLDGVDYGIALFFLVFSVAFLVASTVAIVLFYRERNAFEIRARSAYLVMLTGVSFMSMVATVMVHHARGVTGYDFNIFAEITFKYFSVVCSTCCYGSRTIRLSLLSNPRARKAAPWLLPERNHVVVCILLGLAATIAPLYDLAVVSGRGKRQQDVETEFVEMADDHLWIISLTSKIFVVAINPLTWFVDDIFNLGRELRVFAVVLLVQIVEGKALEGADESVVRWADERNVEVLSAAIMVSLSLIHPIQRRLLHPLQSSCPTREEALQRRKHALVAGIGNAWRSARGGHSFWNEQDSASLTMIPVSDDDIASTRVVSATTSPGSMTYEMAMSMPAVAAAFEEFSRKALCQESLFFLKDVTIYQSKFSETDEEKKVNDGAGGGRYSDHQPEEEQFGFLSYMVREYIVDGAPNEVNLSSKDKKSIIGVYKLGQMGFHALPERRKRDVFVHAYSEIRYILESNLMRTFVATEAFKEARVGD